MTRADDAQTQWFSEPCQSSRFSLAVKAKRHEETTPYQRIEIFETEGFGNIMVIDGYMMLSARDNCFYHEMLSHPALYTHPDPKRVLIVGGGDCGTLSQVLAHESIIEAWQVDIDERVTRLSEAYFPELCRRNGDPRARLVFSDGVAWLRDCEPGYFDAILIDSTDPVGPGVALFQADFYALCHKALGERGLIVQQSESPLYDRDTILFPMRRNMAQAGFDGCHTIFFPQPVYPLGWWTATLAAKNLDPADFREADAAAKAFPTDYYNAAIHRAAMAQPEFFRRAVEEQGVP